MVEFIDGEPPHASNNPWSQIVSELKQRPGVWAKVKTLDAGESAYSAASHARRYHQLDTRVRKLDDQNLWVLYCRYPEP